MPLLADSLRNLYASLIIMALVIAALVLGRAILMPLAIAILIAFVLAPVVRWLAARHVPQSAAAAGVLGLAMTLIIAMSLAFSAQMLSMTADLDSYKQNLIEKVRTVASFGRGDGLIHRATDAMTRLGSEIEREIGRGAAAPANEPVVVSQSRDGKPMEIISGLGTVLGPLGQVGLTILFALLLLLQHHDIRDRVVKIAGTDRLSGTAAAISDAGGRLSQLFLALAVMNAIFGIYIGVALWLIGVPNPLVWGVLAMLMRFVPFIGSIILAVPPILLAAAVDPGWGMMIATIAVIVVGEVVMGNFVEPFLLGRKAGLTAFGMIAAASFWTLVWGPIGLLLSAPLTTAIVVFGHHIGGLQFLSVLFGDQPALSPAQEFYHRLLAGDPVAAAATLEEEAEERNPVQLSDDVILPALQLAAHDRRRRSLDDEQAESLRETMKEAGELAFADEDGRQAGTEAPAPSGEAYVIPARGIVDIAAAEYVADLVRRTTPCTAVVATRSTGLTAIADYRAREGHENVDAIVIVTVGGIDTHQLRLLARRAARDFPKARHFTLAVEEPAMLPGVRDSGREEGDGAIQTRVAPIIAALDCAPSRREKNAEADTRPLQPTTELVARSA